MDASRDLRSDADAATPKSAAFTPGPWRAIPEAGTHRMPDQGSWGVTAASGEHITWAIGYGGPRRKETKANATLMAASPELYWSLVRQCENMAFILNRVDLHGFHEKFEAELAEDRAVLLKALGQSSAEQTEDRLPG